MPEILWWKKESWYEAKSIPLFGFFVSPRQVIFLLGFGLMGFLTQLALPVYFAKVAVVIFFVLAGGALSSFPANVVPWEVAIFASLVYREKRAPEPRGPKMIEPQAHRLRPRVPLTVTGELSVERPTEVILYVDGRERARASVSPSSPKYRLYYVPEPEERGAHELAVSAGGSVIDRITVEVD